MAAYKLYRRFIPIEDRFEKGIMDDSHAVHHVNIEIIRDRIKYTSIPTIISPSELRVWVENKLLYLDKYINYAHCI